MSTRLMLLAKGRWDLFTAHLLVLIGANLIIQSMGQWSQDFLTFQLGFAALTLALPFTLKELYSAVGDEVPVFAKQLVPERGGVQLGDELKRLATTPLVLLAALLMLVAGSLSTEIFGIPWRGPTRFIFYCWAAVFFVGYGIASWLYFAMMVGIARIGRSEAESSVFAWPRSKVQALYSCFLRLFLLGAVLYLGAVVSVWISPGGAWIAKNTGIGRLWVFPPGAMVIFFCLWFNYQCHRILERSRSNSEKQLSEMAEAKFSEWARAPSKEIAASVQSLLDWRERIRQEGTWLVNFKSVAATVVTLLLPTAKAVVDMMR